MWISPNLIGPQKGPATPARLRARWRAVDVEHREAVAVRREWMTLIGCDVEEIDEACETEFELDLVEELEQLAAAKRLK